MPRLRIPWILRSWDVARMASVGAPFAEEGGKVGSVKGRFEEEGGVVVGAGSAGLVFPFLAFCLLVDSFLGLPPPPPPLGGLVLGSFVGGVGDLEGSGLVTMAGVSVVGSGSPAVVMVAGRPISLKRVSTSGSVRGAREVAISAKVLPLPLRWRMAMSSAVVHGVGGVGSAAGGAEGVGSAGGAEGVGSGAAGAAGSGMVVVGGLRRWGFKVSW